MLQNFQYMICSAKTRLIAYFEMTVLNIQCVGTRQWLKLQVPNFHTLYTNFLHVPSRVSTVEESIGYVSHHFYSVLTVSGEFQQRREAGQKVGKMVVLIFKRERGVEMYLAKLWAIQGFKLHRRYLYYSTPQSCTATHSHPLTSQAAIWTPDRLYRSSLCYREEPHKSRPLQCCLF